MLWYKKKTKLRQLRSGSRRKSVETSIAEDDNDTPTSFRRAQSFIIQQNISGSIKKDWQAPEIISNCNIFHCWKTMGHVPLRCFGSSLWICVSRLWKSGHYFGEAKELMDSKPRPAPRYWHMMRVNSKERTDGWVDKLNLLVFTYNFFYLMQWRSLWGRPWYELTECESFSNRLGQ